MGKTTATLIGFTAVLMWAMLAMLSARSGTMPPFQLAAITFLIGGSIGLVSWLFRPAAVKSLRQDWKVWALGVIGSSATTTSTSRRSVPHPRWR